MKQRCLWAVKHEIEQEYHDHEWGIPLHDEQKLFEFLCLEGAQAGLSWLTILQKRENYRQAFDQFEVQKVAQYNQQKVEELLKNEGIVRNKLKVNAFISNAKAFIAIQEEFGSFDAFIWRFTENKTIQNNWKAPTDIPATTPLSEKMSKVLKKKGFKFVGPTICYALMQAIGMVNDHTTDCFRYDKLK